jgi:hypothetical protein
VIRSSSESSMYAADTTICHVCLHAIGRYDYSCDALGRTIEVCPKCGPRLLILRIGAPKVKKGGRDVSLAPRRTNNKCIQCKARFSCSGAGIVPERCPACTEARRVAKGLEYNRKNREKRAAASKRDRVHISVGRNRGRAA